MNESAMGNTSRTDWTRIDAMTDEDIDTSDIPPLDEEFFEKAALRMPSSELSIIAVPVDAETLGWLQSTGEAAEKHMIAALRIYAESQKRAVALQHGN
jgi:hypothetical protein